MTIDDEHVTAGPEPVVPEFRADWFRARLEKTFQVAAGDEQVPLRLVEVADERSGGGFVRFSVLFHGPAARVLPQGTYSFHDEALASFDLFIVPVIGSDAVRIVYEACFSRPIATLGAP